MKSSATNARNLRRLLLLNVFAAAELGARIARAREHAGLTQEDLGDLINLSTRQIQNLEAGSSKPYKHLEAIAEVTGKPVEWFLREDEDEATTADLHQVLAEVAEMREQIARILALLQEPPRARRESS